MLYGMRNVDDFEQLLDRLAGDIKTLRLSTGMSQEALALSADVDRTYISQLERGIANPSLQILYRIAKVLKADLGVVFQTAPKENFASKQ